MCFVSVLLACNLILLVNSSRCPEPRKPHLTSCTIFYDCVNLPDGGYVWVPSKCSEGLVFQPYLRICVVPGDIWTCDTLSTERTPATKKYGTLELIDSTDTSYLGYTPDPPEFSEIIDSSYVIDDFSDSTTEAVTAYPLIEFEESDRTTSDDKGMRNLSYHKEKNYSYGYTNNQEEAALSLIKKYKDIVDSHYKWLNELMNRLHVCKELSAAISDSLPVPIRDMTTVNPIQTITIFASHNRQQNISLNYLVQSHTEANQLHNSKPIEVEVDRPQVDNIATTSGIVPTESTLALLIDSLDPDNNVIRITDNVGNKQYLTIDAYRAVAHRLTPRSVSVVACTRNVRLPNGTDCSRYYTCDPRTASVMEHSCPPHTAFNMNSRICEIESAKMCGNYNLPTSEIFVESATTRSEESLNEGLCQEIGKIKDPTSDSHYYICYNMPGSEHIKSIRMTCPNILIFCQSKKVCTTKRLCDVLP